MSNVKYPEFAGQRAWFPEARFGIFVHFGLYALHGGNENDYTSGFMSRTKYERLMRRFDPRRFRADDWVRLAQDNGGRYIVLTTKHGEGFCLWDSDQTAYKITNAPFGRDLVAELAAACHRRGLRLGFYFSCCDWHYQEPGEGTREGRTYAGYFEAQLRELMTRYGRVDLVWFDGGDKRLTIPFIQRMNRLIHELQPSAVVDDRGLAPGSFFTVPTGDYVSPERYVPENVGPRHRFIECCDAMGQKGWGYHRAETFWSTPELLRRLSRAASLGGNYLLNVEPQPDGRIRPECVERLQAMGRWLRANGEAVFGADGCAAVPLDPSVEARPALGVTTRDGNRVYVHFHAWPSGDSVVLPGVTGKLSRARLLGNKVAAKATVNQGNLLLDGLPSSPPPIEPAVVRLDFDGAPRIKAKSVGPIARTLRLPAGEDVSLPLDAAALASPDGYCLHRVKRHPDGRATLGFFIKPRARVIWSLQVERAGWYDLSADLGTMETQSDAEFAFRACGQELRGRTALTGGYDQPRRMKIGRLRLKKGNQKLTFEALNMPKNCFSDVHAVVLRSVGK